MGKKKNMGKQCLPGIGARLEAQRQGDVVARRVHALCPVSRLGHHGVGGSYTESGLGYFVGYGYGVFFF